MVALKYRSDHQWLRYWTKPRRGRDSEDHSRAAMVDISSMVFASVCKLTYRHYRLKLCLLDRFDVRHALR